MQGTNTRQWKECDQIRGGTRATREERKGRDGGSRAQRAEARQTTTQQVQRIGCMCWEEG
jgi:hypothetical protein